MRIIGITGGICSGKSHVSDRLRYKGYYVIDCDKITDELYNYQYFTDGLRHIFGKKIIYNKEVNRGKLGALVFKDPKEMKKLNNYCLPFIFKEINKQLNDCVKQGLDVVFIDAPILFESGLQNEVPFTDFWVISVEPYNQVARLKKRKPYLTSRAIHNILDSQLSNKERLQYATYVLENNIRNRSIFNKKIDEALQSIGLE